ncbi:MAG: hypothetical protein KGI89_03080 [Euryarchaeota archaeon]|nr:hypothetical protein [Euryarchaeota archaeon]
MTLMKRYRKDFGSMDRLVDAALGWAWANGQTHPPNGFHSNGRTYSVNLPEDYRLVPPRELGNILERSLKAYDALRSRDTSLKRVYTLDDKVRVDAPHAFFHVVARRAFEEGVSLDAMMDRVILEALERVEERLRRKTEVSDDPETHYVPMDEQRYLTLLRACAERGLKLDALLSWEVYERL